MNVKKHIGQMAASVADDRPSQSHPSLLAGLSAGEVAERCAAGQVNQVTLHSSRTYRQIIRENVLSLINGVFIFIAIVLFSLSRWEDAATITLMIVAGSGINLFQEVRAKRKLDQIALLTRPIVTVVREGQHQSIAPDEIVLGGANGRH